MTKTENLRAFDDCAEHFGSRKFSLPCESNYSKREKKKQLEMFRKQQFRYDSSTLKRRDNLRLSCKTSLMTYGLTIVPYQL